MRRKILIKTGVLSLKLFLHNSFVFAKMTTYILKDNNLEGKEKAILTIFSVMKFLEHDIT